MLKTAAEEFLDNWPASDIKLFKLEREFLPLEYISIRKHHSNSYQVEAQYSSTSFEPSVECFNKEEMLEIVTKERLKYFRPWRWGDTAKDLKTGGCDCGAWILKDGANLHDSKCPARIR